MRTEVNRALGEVLRSVAEERGHTVAQVARAWVGARSGVVFTLVGARRAGQLRENIAALELTLTPEQTTRLDAASANAPGFTDTLAAPAVRRMIFGGNGVEGWTGNR